MGIIDFVAGTTALKGPKGIMRAGSRTSASGYSMIEHFHAPGALHLRPC